jgi:hypothetical protein
LEWLSADLQKNPQGLKNFLNSHSGRAAIVKLFDFYRNLPVAQP